MPYAQLDDGFYDHPRFAFIDDDLVGIWAKGLAFCNRHLTDGLIPKTKAKAFCVTADPMSVIDRMIAAKLWRDVGDHVEHIGFLDHNPSRSEVRAKQKAAKARKDKWKETNEGTRSEHDPGNVPAVDEERGQNNAPPSLPPSLFVNTKVREADVQVVFDHWLRVLAPLKFKRGVGLTSERRRIIVARLREFSTGELCQAIDGVRKSSHHCGQNDSGEFYVDFTSIFRNRSKVEGHIARVDGPTRKAVLSPAERAARRTGRVQDELDFPTEAKL